VVENLFDGWFIRKSIYPLLVRTSGSSGDIVLPSCHRVVSRISRGFSGELPPKWTSGEGHLDADVIGCFRCDGRLIREAVEIDFRVGKRLLAAEIP